MSKCIFFCIPAHGHVNAQLGLVEALVKKGEEVIYYCAPAFREKIEKTGAEFRPFTTSGDSLVRDLGHVIGLNTIRVARLIADVSNEAAGIASEIAGREKPGYIISDIITWHGAAAAEKNNIPLITFLPVFATNYSMGDALPPSFILRMLWHALISPVDMIRFIAGAVKLRKYFKKEAMNLLNVFSRASDMNIVAISRRFQYKEGVFPQDRFVFTGPMIFPAREKADFPVEKLRGKKTVYISLGTVYHRNPRFFEECVKAFGDSNYMVVMSMPGGAENMLRQETGLPDNFIVRDNIPQLQVLQHADVFITHAGMNSIQEAMYFGVPVIAVPQATDQYLNGSRAEKLGAGICINKSTPKAAVLRDAVEKVINNPSYREKAKLEGDEARKAGGAAAALAAIENFKVKNGIV